MKIAYAVTGSFCTHSCSLAVLEELVKNRYEVFPILSEIVQKETTRFGTREHLYENVTLLCGREPITTVNGAEAVITRGEFDCVAVCPCTGNTMAKIANGITDSTVTMAVKAQLRSNRPVLLALASNDALGGNLKNLGICADKKNVFFVPMKQDDPVKKPYSLVSDFAQALPSLKLAVKGIQIRPLIVS